MLLSNLVFLALAILAMSVLQAQAGAPTEIPLLAIFIGLFVISMGLLFWHLRNLRLPRVPN